MPLRKPEKDFKPLWREWDRSAQKEGQRNTVYFVNGDQYTGEWKDNKKCGKKTTSTSKLLISYVILNSCVHVLLDNFANVLESRV